MAQFLLITTLLSIAGLILLLWLAKGRPLHTTGFAVYGVTLILLYTASTLYHSLHTSLEGEFVLMRLDHCAIFLLIAGTYTPVCLITLHGALGYAMLAAVWGLGIFGCIGVFKWKLRFEVARVVLCVIMGWMALLAFGPLKAAWPPQAPRTHAPGRVSARPAPTGRRSRPCRRRAPVSRGRRSRAAG